MLRSLPVNPAEEARGALIGESGYKSGAPRRGGFFNTSSLS